MFCRNCGAKIDDTNKFCPYCGSKVITDDVPQTSSKRPDYSHNPYQDENNQFIQPEIDYEKVLLTAVKLVPVINKFFDDVMVLSLTALGTPSDLFWDFVNIANYK